MCVSLLISTVALTALYGSEKLGSIEAYADTDASGIIGEPRTPLQIALAQVLEEQAGKGFRPEIVRFKSSVFHSDGITIVNATTTIQFTGPQQAGSEEWPGLKMSIDDRFVQISKKDMARAHPDLFGEKGPYDFGHEPRRLTIEESFVQQDVDVPVVAQVLDPLHDSTTGDVVMGFSRHRVTENTITQTLSNIAGPFARATLEFTTQQDMDLRFPVTVKLRTPDVIEPSRDYFLKSSLTPRNFLGSQYEALGLDRLEGKEFNATVGLVLDIRLNVDPGESIQKHLSKSLDISQICQDNYSINCSNFTTPFGVDGNGQPREFPMPAIRLGPEETGLSVEVDTPSVLGTIGVGLRLIPDFDAKNIAAGWAVTDDALLEPTSGTILFTSGAPTEFSFGPLRAIGGGTDTQIGQAEVTLDNFRFNVDRFTLAFGGRLEFEGTALGFDEPVLNSFFEIIPDPALPNIVQLSTDAVSPDVDVLSGAGVPSECRPFKPAKGGGGVHDLVVVNNRVFLAGDDVTVKATLSGGDQIDQVRFLWYDLHGDLVQEKVVKKPTTGWPGSVRNTFVGVYGNGDNWHVIACYEDKTATLALNKLHIGIASFFVLPESPVGVLSLVGTALASLAGYYYLNRGKSRNTPTRQR